MQKGTLVNLVSYYYWMLVTGIGQARAETLHGGKEESVRQDQQDLHEALLLFPPLSQFHPSGAASSPEDLHAGGEAPPGRRPSGVETPTGRNPETEERSGKSCLPR